MYVPAILDCLVLSSMRSRYARSRARLSMGAAIAKKSKENRETKENNVLERAMIKCPLQVETERQRQWMIDMVVL